MRFLLFTLLLLGHSMASALSIQHVTHSPKNIAENSEVGVVVRFYLDHAASVMLKIYDDRGYLVRTVASEGVFKEGDNSINWDGRDNRGNPVPAEAYHYTLQAEQSNETVTYDVTDLLSSNKNTIRNVEWDREKGEISYLLVADSRINIRAGIANGGPLLTTIINWLPRKRGKHVEKWNGYGKGNKFNISKIPKASIFTEAYTFSKNTIIVGEPVSSAQYVDASELTDIRKKGKSDKVMFDNARKNVGDRSDYNIAIQLPESKLKKHGFPVYKGKVAVKLAVPKDDLQRMSRDRFEPILFVDGQYVSEIETGFFPITWHLDTTVLKPGEHYITVNVRGYDGQYGSVSQRIYVEN